MPAGELLLVVGALLAAGLVASMVAGRVRVPALVLFLGVGMAIGSDGTGWIAFDNYEVARTIGTVALALILFEGGLTAGFSEIRPVLGPAISLAVGGTVATAVLTGVAAVWLFDFSTLEGMLLGSILAGTDAAAIFAALRDSTLRRRLARTLEGESGLNDPVAVLLVIGFVEWLTRPDYGIMDMLALLGQELVIGAAVGLAVGAVAAEGFRRARLVSPGLFPVASLATVALAFGAADVLHGSGFLAAYLGGLWLGSAKIPGQRAVTVFHEGVGWVAQIVMFLTLGLLVFPSQLGDVAVEGTVLALVTAVLARPVATALATAPFRFSSGERLVLGWAGLRGAVPVVLATFPVIAEVPGSLEFFNIVFFVVLLSTLAQGTTFEPLARALGVTTRASALPEVLTETGTISRLGAEVVEFDVGAEDAVAGARVRDLGLPREALLNVIVRGEEAIPPRGSTRLEAGDELHVLVRQEAAAQLPPLLERWRAGPIGPPPRLPRPPRSRSPVFTMRPWREEDGRPDRPDEVLDAAVVEHLRTRRDAPGALVLLADGRVAACGPTLAVGGRDQLADYARRRLRRTEDARERAWWEEVIGALAV